jgi:cation:H+ antiporter
LLVPGFLLDGELSRAEGMLLTLSIVVYVILTIRTARKTPQHVAATASSVPVLSKSLWMNFLLSVGALTMLIVGSDLLVTASVTTAVALGVPSAVIGLSAAALGTSLPELTASIVAARHGHPEMAVGNLIGSNIFNLLMILGVTSLFTPLDRGGVTRVDLAVMVVVSLFALTLMVTKNRIERVEGLALITIYALYIMWLFVAGAF